MNLLRILNKRDVFLGVLGGILAFLLTGFLYFTVRIIYKPFIDFIAGGAPLSLFIYLFLYSPITEELLKYFGFKFFSGKSNKVKWVGQILIVSIVFTILEHLMYCLAGGAQFTPLRFLSLVHPAASIILIYFILLNKPFLGFLFSILFHGAYNFIPNLFSPNWVNGLSHFGQSVFTIGIIVFLFVIPLIIIIVLFKRSSSLLLNKTTSNLIT
ncbi:MAG: hypothetical protein PHV78_01665 [Patescibacteria group bacterium]|nr:hypothetical protein [Patescibacteria group bacterium]MDD5121141.1 hypothetical protein [Patescibacteria group bacterium]MDD5221656.1 hypothetical protein [Patescibacteria group bacterium]MDD5395940.1 hypothetical protein [Patescibacteria group bacterium]